MSVCPNSGLVLPKEFIDEKQSLKKIIDSYLDRAVEMFDHLDYPYFLTFHAKFNPLNPGEFMVDPPKITNKLPPFLSNTMVFWINNKKGICEMLWMVTKKPGDKNPRIEFNTNGVAYLQAKGAMPHAG